MRVSRRDPLGPRAVAYFLPAGMAVVWVFHDNASTVGAIWLVFFATVLAQHAGAESFLTRPLQRFLVLPPLVWLGKLSYCTYLCHTLVLGPIATAMSPHLAAYGARGRFLAILAIAAPTIIAVSAALHYLVEKPGYAASAAWSALARPRARACLSSVPACPRARV